jgi:hypothetical protein
MKEKIRILNSAGISIFSAWLASPSSEPPLHILTDSNYCSEVFGEYILDTDRVFETSYELGRYLHDEVFLDISDPVALEACHGMWAWISLALIHSLLSRSTARKGRPLDQPHYFELPGPQGRRLGYRLIARTAWRLVRLHGPLA